MQAGFAIALRIGISAGFLISVLYGTVVRVGRQDWQGLILNSILGGLIFSILIAFLDMLGLFAREGRTEEILEGTGMLVLSLGIAWLIIWLRRVSLSGLGFAQNGHPRPKNRISILISGMAFLAVGREGYEVIRPLYSRAFIDEPIAVALGVALALLTAFVLGWALHNYLISTSQRNYRRAAWLVLLFIGAGLLTNATHEFTQAGLIPSLGIPSWGLVLFGPQSAFGYLLLAIVGNETVPTFNELFAFSAYVFVLGWIILRALSKGSAPLRLS